jgi:hypothetical protein
MRVLILVKNDLAVRANVKVVADIMDPSVQLVWLHFSHHRIGSATLGAFILGGIYREWTPLLCREESRLRLGSLLHQISKATEDGLRVVIHGDFNIDLDRVDDRTYYMATLAKSLAECTASAGLETHATPPTFRSFGNFIPAGDLSRLPGDVASPAEGGPSPEGGGPSPAVGLPSPAGGVQSPTGDFHKYARLDHVYTKGLISESKLLPDSTTDHRPVVTTVRAGSHGPGTKLVSLKRRNFKAITRQGLEGALNLTDWSKVYNIKDVDAVLDYITAGIVSALNVVALEKEIRVKKGPNLYLRRETLEAMKKRDGATGRRYRILRIEVSRLVRRDKQDSNLLSLKKAGNDPRFCGALQIRHSGKTARPCLQPSSEQTAPPPPSWRRPR